MQSVPVSLVSAIRRFNRFYTNVLGLLNHHMLESDYSLPEVRVLYELYHHDGLTAKTLTENLTIDPGYFSRIIKHLEKLGFVKRIQSDKDGRSYLLYLTDEGKETFTRLDRMSDRQIAGLVEHLPEESREKLYHGMTTVEEVLKGGQSTKAADVVFRRDLRPGDAGKLISLHGWIYQQECGYDHSFEGYVCQTFYEFLNHYDPAKDRVWFVEAGSQMVGAIAIVGHSETRAQLRWFILHPEYRGQKLGSRLMQEALAYCREKGYRDVFLLTTLDQQTAIRMYEKAGFRKASAHETYMWGKNLTELTFELHMD